MVMPPLKGRRLTFYWFVFLFVSGEDLFDWFILSHQRMVTPPPISAGSKVHFLFSYCLICLWRRFVRLIYFFSYPSMVASPLIPVGSKVDFLFSYCPTYKNVMHFRLSSIQHNRVMKLLLNSIQYMRVTQVHVNSSRSKRVTQLSG